MVHAAASAATVPVAGLLALLIAESGLNPRAERWGSETRHAQILLERLEAGGNGQATQELANLVATEWPDISFGYSQRIVLYHWWGNGTRDLSNILSVRKMVFGSPARDITEAAFKLAWCLEQADGDIMEGLMVYNFGHVVPPNKRGAQFKAHWNSYKAALAEAARMLNATSN